MTPSSPMWGESWLVDSYGFRLCDDFIMRPAFIKLTPSYQDKTNWHPAFIKPTE